MSTPNVELPCYPQLAIDLETGIVYERIDGDRVGVIENLEHERAYNSDRSLSVITDKFTIHITLHRPVES